MAPHCSYTFVVLVEPFGSSGNDLQSLIPVVPIGNSFRVQIGYHAFQDFPKVREITSCAFGRSQSSTL